MLVDRFAINEKINKKWDRLNVDFSAYKSKSINLRVHDVKQWKTPRKLYCEYFNNI